MNAAAVNTEQPFGDAQVLLQILLTGEPLVGLLGGKELNPRVAEASRRAAGWLLPQADDLRRRAQVKNRLLSAFLAEGIAESDLAGTTGYGYHDAARERYESVLARFFGAESALARIAIASGTHAILLTCSALIPSGQRLISVTGRPYDTLHYAIAEAPGSLSEQGILYESIALDAAGRLDLDAIATTLTATDRPPVAAIFVQRSRGYAPRPSLPLAELETLVPLVRRLAPDAVILVDNCYGELVEEREPTAYGVDVVMGSLIKNLGGGIAPTGGYVVGRAALIDRVARRLYAPGIGAALGPTLGLGRLFFQGLFLAPQVVWEAIRGLRFAAALFHELGFLVDPMPTGSRCDIVQAIGLETRPRLEAFARALQRVLPINAHFRPEPGAVPGYVDPVIMSDGAFVGGATIELSCDAPLRPPYQMYLQGGSSAEHVALGALYAAHAVCAEA